MNRTRYILWIAEKKGSIEKTQDVEREFEIKSITDIRYAISVARYSLFLYLGPYELGELYGRTNKFITFLSLMGVTSNYGFSAELFEKVINQPISLPKFFEAVITEYSMNIADNSDTAWMLLQNGWKSAYRVAGFVNPLQTDKKSIINDKSIFFIRKKM